MMGLEKPDLTVDRVAAILAPIVEQASLASFGQRTAA